MKSKSSSCIEQKSCRAQNALLTLLAILLAWPAQADDATNPAAPNWEATIVPAYGWITGINGHVGARGVTASIEVSPMDVLRNLGDLIEALDGIYMGSGQIRYRKFGFAYDAVHFKVSSVNEFSGERSTSFSASRPGIGPIAGPDLTLTAGGRVDGIVDVAFSYTMSTFAGTYRAFETPSSQLDVVAGVRVTDIDVKIGVVADATVAANANLTFGGISKSIAVTAGRNINATARGSETWVDPIIGVQGRSKIDRHWFVTGWAMIGGFGANSDFLFDLMGGVGYEWSNGISAFAGYRVSDTDYQNDDFRWDLTMHGPIIGASVRF